MDAHQAAPTLDVGEQALFLSWCQIVDTVYGTVSPSYGPGKARTEDTHVHRPQRAQRLLVLADLDVDVCVTLKKPVDDDGAGIETVVRSGQDQNLHERTPG